MASAATAALASPAHPPPRRGPVSFAPCSGPAAPAPAPSRSPV
uniref:Uncharacterized protein n=1 Tax=Arundo donax TaxID=35708 RepID=A0A0A9FW29_ARUDO